jgi:tetratricopeptide (TPR) repeat protein
MILALAAAASLAASSLAAPACPPGNEPGAWLCKAVAASDAEQFAVAAAAFDQAAAGSPASDPKTPRMLAAAGNMWIAAGQPGKAALSLDRALAAGLPAEQRGLALLDRARAAEAQDDLKAARRFASQAGESLAEDPFYWYFSAALALRENDLAVARLAIARALALAPDSAEILFEAGHVAQAEGDAAKARDYWQRAIAADPTGKTARSAAEALRLVDVPLTVSTQPKAAK